MRRLAALAVLLLLLLLSFLLLTPLSRRCQVNRRSLRRACLQAEINERLAAPFLADGGYHIQYQEQFSDASLGTFTLWTRCLRMLQCGGTPSRDSFIVLSPAGAVELPVPSATPRHNDAAIVGAVDDNRTCNSTRTITAANQEPTAHYFCLFGNAKSLPPSFPQTHLALMSRFNFAVHGLLDRDWFTLGGIRAAIEVSLHAYRQKVRALSIRFVLVCMIGYVSSSLAIDDPKWMFLMIFFPFPLDI